MRITRDRLHQAVEAGVLNERQGDALWSFLSENEAETPKFKPSHILYYLGGLIAIGAMTLFMTLGWERFGGTGLLWISSCYFLLAIAVTEFFLRKKHMAIPAGITATLAVCMVPLAVYAIQNVLGMWPDDGRFAYRDFHTYIDWRWIIMELSTLAAGVIVLWRYRLPFMVLPIAVTLWYMSMDLVPFLLGADRYAFFSDTGKLISMYFGLFMTLLAFWVDMRTIKSKDFAFWLYIFGVLTFWGGLTSLDSNSEFNKFLYCCLNLLMIGIGAAFSRRVFAVFGGLGVAGYLGHLSYTVFKDSLLFPVALSAIGFAVIAVGVVWQRHEETIGKSLRSLLPVTLSELIATRAD